MKNLRTDVDETEHQEFRVIAAINGLSMYVLLGKLVRWAITGRIDIPKLIAEDRESYNEKH